MGVGSAEPDWLQLIPLMRFVSPQNPPMRHDCRFVTQNPNEGQIQRTPQSRPNRHKRQTLSHSRKAIQLTRYARK